MISDPVYLKAYTEFTYYPLFTEHLQNLLKDQDNSLIGLFPINKTPQLNLNKMKDLAKWLKKNGNHIIYIYGALDPYTACAVVLGKNTNAVIIVQWCIASIFLKKTKRLSIVLLYP